MSQTMRRGFVPARSLVGGGSGALRHKLYHTSANRSSPIFLGDAVSLSGGEIVRSSVTSADSTNFVGIAVGMYDTNKKPLQGTGRLFLNTSAGGYVDVCDDPMAVYTVECETCIDQSRVGAVAWLNVSADTLSSATGISRTSVNLTSGAGGNPLFRIVGLAPMEVAVTADGSISNQIEVVAIDGIFRSH